MRGENCIYIVESEWESAPRHRTRTRFWLNFMNSAIQLPHDSHHIYLITIHLFHHIASFSPVQNVVRCVPYRQHLPFFPSRTPQPTISLRRTSQTVIFAVACQYFSFFSVFEIRPFLIRMSNVQIWCTSFSNSADNDDDDDSDNAYYLAVYCQCNLFERDWYNRATFLLQMKSFISSYFNYPMFNESEN